MLGGSAGYTVLGEFMVWDGGAFHFFLGVLGAGA